MKYIEIIGNILEKRIIFLLIVIVAISGCTASVSTTTKTSSVPSLTKVSVALDWFPYSGHAGLFIAKERGYFVNEQLDVELNVPSDPTTVLQTVATGRDDFGISFGPDVLIAREQAIPVVSVMVLIQHPISIVMTLEDSGIKTPKDLIGKKIGTTGNPTAERLLDTMVKYDGVVDGTKAIDFVNVGFDLVPSLISKRVDAVAGAFEIFELISAENQGFSVNVMEVEDYGVPDYYELSLVTSDKMIAENPDIVQRFVRAAMRGYEDAMDDPQSAVQLMKQVRPEVDLTIDSPGVDILAPLWKSENGIFGWQEESRWFSFTQWMKDNGLLSEDLDATKAFDNSFVANAGK